MRKVCHVSKILCFTNGVTASASKFSSVAIRAPEHANNAVNATQKLKLNFRAVIENTFYVQRKTGHHSAPKDAREHWTVDMSAPECVTKTVQCKNVKVLSSNFFHAAISRVSLATLTPKRLFVTLHVNDSWIADIGAHLCVVVFATRFDVKKCVKRGVSEVMPVSDGATLVRPVMIARKWLT